MSGRSRQNNIIDANWQVERLRRSSKKVGSTRLDDVRMVEELGPADPPAAELLADTMRTAAGVLMDPYEKEHPEPAVAPLLEVAEALGCTLADVELGLQRLREARARRLAEAGAA